MKNLFTLFGFTFLLLPQTFAQTQDLFQKNFQKVREDLVEWDANRGSWLASSMEAMAFKKPTPDRTFPEEFTPAEMFQVLPATTQDAVRGQIRRATTNADSSSRAQWERINAFTSRVGNCKLVMGRTYGDPHLKSFDGASYSFQTVGEFTLVKSASNHMNIQVRQRPQRDDFSLNTAVAMNVDGDRIAFYANEKPDGNTTTPLRINGEPIYIDNQNYYLEHGGTITKLGSNDFLVTWPSGERVKLDQSSSGGMGFYNIAVEIYPCGDTYDGILGNANGRASDDFEANNTFSRTNTWNMGVFGSTNRNDQFIEKEYLAFLAKDFARHYRITQQESLFDYGFNQSTLAFTDESFPRVHLTIGDLSQDDYRRAQRDCQRRGFTGPELSACIYDNGFLRIEPTPAPVIPNRTTGRQLEPIRTPITNRNPGQKPYNERYPEVTTPTKPTIRSTPETMQKVENATINTNPTTSSNPTRSNPNTQVKTPEPHVNPNPVVRPTTPVPSHQSEMPDIKVSEPVRTPSTPNTPPTSKPKIEVREPVFTPSPTVTTPRTNTPSRTNSSPTIKTPTTTPSFPSSTPNTPSRTISTPSSPSSTPKTPTPGTISTPRGRL